MRLSLGLLLLPVSLLATALCWLAAVARLKPSLQAQQMDGALSPLPRWMIVCFTGFGLLSLLSLWSVAQPQLHLAGWLGRYGLLTVFYLLSLRFLQQQRLTVDTLLPGLLGGSFLCALIALGNALLDWALEVHALCWPGIENACLIYLYLAPEDRATGIAMHSNVLGALLALSLPFWLLVLGKGRQNPLRQLLLLLGLACILGALLLSFSRAAWISGGLSLWFAARLFLNVSWRQGLGMLLGVSLCGLFWLNPELGLSLYQRLLSILTLFAADNTRLAIWQSGLQMLQDFWASGIGLLNFEHLYPAYQQGAIPAAHLHNLWLQSAVESGLPAALLLWTALAGLLGSPRQLSPLGQAAWLAWALWLLGSLVDCTFFDLRLSCLLVLLLALMRWDREHSQKLVQLRQQFRGEIDMLG